MKASDRWRIFRGDLTEMPNPLYEEQEKEINRLRLLAEPYLEKITPKYKALLPVAEELSRGQIVALAIGLLIEYLENKEKENVESN